MSYASGTLSGICFILKDRISQFTYINQELQTDYLVNTFVFADSQRSPIGRLVSDLSVDQL